MFKATVQSKSIRDSEEIMEFTEPCAVVCAETQLMKTQKEAAFSAEMAFASFQNEL